MASILFDGISLHGIGVLQFPWYIFTGAAHWW